MSNDGLEDNFEEVLVDNAHRANSPESAFNGLI
jgi:hypothetical protein